jgi:hypothetical protein
MTALLGTLPFLATLWLLVVLGARALEQSGAKIAAALRGEAIKPPALGHALRKRPTPRPQKAICASAEWRVAA